MLFLFRAYVVDMGLKSHRYKYYISRLFYDKVVRHVDKERCQSGRMEHTANVLNGKPFRGFESLPLRREKAHISALFR